MTVDNIIQYKIIYAQTIKCARLFELEFLRIRDKSLTIFQLLLQNRKTKIKHIKFVALLNFQCIYTGNYGNRSKT